MGNPKPRTQPDWRAGMWLAVGAGLLCLLTAGGSMTSKDPVVAYDVTVNLVERQSLATRSDHGLYDAYRGVDGQYYSPFGVAQSVWNIPFYLVGRALANHVGAGIGPDVIPKATVALGTVPAVALLAWVSFQLLLALGATPSRAVGTVLLLIFATPIWPYSGFGFNQPLMALFLWAAVLGAIAGPARRSTLILSGLCAGLAILTRHESSVAAAVLAAYVAVRADRQRIRVVAWYGAGLLPMIAVWCAVNWVRFGSPIESGYFRDPIVGFGQSMLTGGAGLLFSPYSSVFLYAPIVLLSGAGLLALWRRDRLAAMLFAVLFVTCFAVYASLGNWMGGRSYGPRYLVPLMPALVLPLAFWSPAPGMRWVAAAIIAISLAVQVPGVLVDYAKVRVDRAVAGETVAQDTRWVGMPLLLNARATMTNGARAVRFLAGAEAAPRVDAAGAPLSQALSFSLDLWWLYLAYLGVIGRETAVAIAFCLAAASAGALYRAFVLARGSPV